MAEQRAPRVILYICPRTGRTVQALLARAEQDAHEADQPSKDRYEQVACIDCSDTHLVNLATGAVLGAGAKAL